MPPGFRAGLFVNLTDRCNNVCEFCLSHQKQGQWRSGHELDFEAFMERLAEYEKKPSRVPLGAIHFAGTGEPLLYGRIAEIVSEAAKRCSFVSIVTNGILLDEGLSRCFAGANVSHIVISFTGATREVYGLFQGSGKPPAISDKQFESVRGNVKTLLESRDAMMSSAKIGISYILHEKSRNDYFRALDYWNRAGVDYVDTRILAPDFSRSVDDYGQYLRGTVKNKGGAACTCFGKVMSLSTDGTLRFCNCFTTDNILGNIMTTPLAEMLDSDRFLSLLEAFHGNYKDSPEHCKTCDLGRARPILY
jgi:radical SAM protein with 4Fe4S-binding SPASM domain